MVVGLVIFLSFFLLVPMVFRAMISLRPAFEAKLEQYCNILALEAAGFYDADHNSVPFAKTGLILSNIINAFLGISCVVDNAIYNRPEGTSTFEGAWSRFIDNVLSVSINYALVLPVYAIIVLGVVVLIVCRARARARASVCYGQTLGQGHGHGQEKRVRLEGDDEKTRVFEDWDVRGADYSGSCV
ncbi:hypothetical protein D9758_014831 [Tetrapyrgos nigripes]|uniref:Uncharacterized protein n=1 Tax=Tetrapyrgos nigripes TaxID=182062 RepID=A0A8H5C2U4_9AGAR|nr:hypothetical protein D9758_014831 [Tetrapyrgos nigripes]